MIPSPPALFRLSAAKQKAVKQAQLIQESIVTRYSDQLIGAMLSVIGDALKAAEQGEPLPPLNLSKVDDIAYSFLVMTIQQAFTAAKHQMNVDRMKRLASYPKGKLPPDAHSLAALFRNRKAWDVMVKRNRQYATGIKRAYLQKLRRHFAKVMPLLNAGDITIDEAKAQLESAVKATGPRVNTIFRTETTNYFSQAQVNYFDGEEGILGFLFDSTTDSARTDICRSRHGMVLRSGSQELKKNTPSCHYNCRSHLIPLADTPENRKLFQEPSRQPSNRTLAPLPRGWRSGG